MSALQAQSKEASNKVSALQAELAEVHAELDEERKKVGKEGSGVWGGGVRRLRN